MSFSKKSAGTAIVAGILCICLAAFVFSSRNFFLQEKEYEQIKNGQLSAQTLFQKLHDFEIRNPLHFASKVDLAILLAETQQLDEAKDYLERAENILQSSGRKKTTSKSRASFYELSALINFFEGNLENALLYIEEACKIKTWGIRCNYLKGRILLAMDRKEEALQAMEKAWAKDKIINAEDLRVFMFLTAEFEQYQHCLELVNHYFESAGYFYGLGKFASEIYEKNGLTFEAALLSYLDFEYRSGFEELQESQILSKIEKFEASESEEAGKARECIKAMLKKEKLPQIKSDFWLYNFFCVKNQIITEEENSSQLSEYIKYEKYFHSHPGYYYDMLKALENDIPTPGKEKIIVNLLERIIETGRKSKYADEARLALGNKLGFSRQDSEKILLPIETEALLLEFMADSSKKTISPIFELLALPDCKYVYSAIVSFRNKITNPHVNSALREQLASSSGRLKDRISYILSGQA
ncbi:MAG: hypothetical protein SOT15_08480 [Treponema sp.]|nr:hypothetical protein [Treponema sp.]